MHTKKYEFSEHQKYGKQKFTKQDFQNPLFLNGSLPIESAAISTWWATVTEFGCGILGAGQIGHVGGLSVRPKHPPHVRPLVVWDDPDHNCLGVAVVEGITRLWNRRRSRPGRGYRRFGGGGQDSINADGFGHRSVPPWRWPGD
jgi:hypothetical protein